MPLLKLLQFVMSDPAEAAAIVGLVRSIIANLRKAPPDVLRQVTALAENPDARQDVKKTLDDTRTLLADLVALAKDAAPPAPTPNQ